jgi:hypothetical protein
MDFEIIGKITTLKQLQLGAPLETSGDCVRDLGEDVGGR